MNKSLLLVFVSTPHSWNFMCTNSLRFSPHFPLNLSRLEMIGSSFEVRWVGSSVGSCKFFFFFCNCWQKNTHKDNSTTETYIEITENDFKTSFRNHTASFRHTKLKNATDLNKYIWTLKENHSDHYIFRRILSSRSPYNSANKSCNLCLKEKLLIIRQPELSSLNKCN